MYLIHVKRGLCSTQSQEILGSTLAEEIVLHIPQYWHSIDHILQKYSSIILEKE
ncbi:MAG TPA: hypothetical protein VL201_05165 [Patescibacteria group bacterium]|jgi:hypothetical protein|nr:hypothetical protein [Patescibacteria group bacterium]